MHDAQRAEIGKYCKRKDRGIDPVYVGRKGLFELVADNAEMASAGDTEGRTICIAGPPGMGKTAFLSELARRAARGAGPGVEMLCVDVDPTELHSTAQLLGAVAHALPSKWAPKPRSRVGRILKEARSAGFSIGALGAQISLGAKADVAEFPWRELAELLAEAHNGAVCICVDEAHRLAPSCALGGMMSVAHFPGRPVPSPRRASFPPLDASPSPHIAPRAVMNEGAANAVRVGGIPKTVG